MKQNSDLMKKICLKILGEVPKELTERQHRELYRIEKKLNIQKLVEVNCRKCDEKFLSRSKFNKLCANCNEFAKSIDTSYCI